MRIELEKGVKKVNSIINEILKKKKIVIVSIAGGSASGKTYVAKNVDGKVLSMDDYYIGIKRMKDHNFDKPSALDLRLLKKHLHELKKNKTIKKPIYNFKAHSRSGYEKFKPAKVIIIEGLFALNEILRNKVDLKVFIEMPEKKRLKWRIMRDVKERGRTRDSVIKQWRETVQPNYLKYVLPTKRYADIMLINKFKF